MIPRVMRQTNLPVARTMDMTQRQRMTGLIIATLATRVLVGGVILLAAGLKTHNLLTTPRGDLSASLREMAAEFSLVAAECLLAVWLLSGRQWPMARGLGIVWMIALCGVSFYKAIVGAASCGCFGRFEVNPWITFTLDVAALGTLVLSPAVASAEPSGWRQGAVFGLQAVMVCAIALVLRSPFRRPAPAPAGAPELDPAQWVVGRPWEMGKYVDIWGNISQGQWAVILYSPDCRACTTTRDNYEELSRQWRAAKSPQRVALIDVLGEPDDFDQGTAALYGMLTTPAEWYIPTPTLVILVDGRLVETDQGFEQCQWNDRAFPRLR